MEKKIALCLHGYFGTISTKNDSTSLIGFKHLRETLLNNNNVDIFFHTWDFEKEKIIQKLYNPKKYITEKQKDFSIECSQNNIDQRFIDKNFDRDNTIYLNATFERILSFYYSRCKSLELVFEYEKENNILYDWIITTRFDISARGGNDVNRLKFNSNLDNNKIYSSFWNQLNIGYADMWFFSNSDNMKIYSKIYFDALKDFSKNSEYQNKLVSGWIDSNYFNIEDFNDPRQFTNEVLKNKQFRSNILMKFPLWRASDSHLHHKWFMIKNNLYQISEWI